MKRTNLKNNNKHPKRKTTSRKNNSTRRVNNAPVARSSTIHSGTQNTMRVKRREFVSDVRSGATTREGKLMFRPLNTNLSNGPLTFLAEIAGNLGLSATFPWLSAVASKFERFVVHTMNFDYEPSCPTSTPGMVALSPSYNAGDTREISSKQDVLDRADTVRSPVWSPCKCKLDPKKLAGITKESFVRSGPVPKGQDIKTYDKFKLNALVENASTNSDSTLGELWVDYDVELINPLPDKNIVSASLNRTKRRNGTFTDLRTPDLSIGPCSIEHGPLKYKYQFDGTVPYLRLDLIYRSQVAGTPGFTIDANPSTYWTMFGPSWSGGYDRYSVYYVALVPDSDGLTSDGVCYMNIRCPMPADGTDFDVSVRVSYCPTDEWLMVVSPLDNKDTLSTKLDVPLIGMLSPVYENRNSLKIDNDTRQRGPSIC